MRSGGLLAAAVIISAAAALRLAYPQFFEAPVMAERASQCEVDLNRAGVADLMKLPGIGEKTAEVIIRTRNELGRFRSAEDLLMVKGIGQKKFEKISRYVCVEN